MELIIIIIELHFNRILLTVIQCLLRDVTLRQVFLLVFLALSLSCHRFFQMFGDACFYTVKMLGSNPHGSYDAYEPSV